MVAIITAALAAGMLATVNPCGFAMLPAYLGFFIGEGAGTRRSALGVGLTVSIGFIGVFAVAGALVASGVRVVVAWIPWMAGLVGLGLIVVGVAELRGVHVLIRSFGRGSPTRDRSFRGLVGFGASYAVASLSCTLPVFLSIVAGALTGRTFVEAMLIFGAYGAGMSLAVIVVTVAITIGRGRVLRAIRPLASRLGMVSGWILIVAGGFVVWYWATVLGAGATALATNPITGTIDRMTGWVAGIVSRHPLSVATAAVAVIAVSVLGSRRGRRLQPAGDDSPAATEPEPRSVPLADCRWISGSSGTSPITNRSVGAGRPSPASAVEEDVDPFVVEGE